MNEILGDVFHIAAAIGMVGFCGASFTLGTALVCRALKWSPVTINVTVNQHPAED